MEHPLPDLEVDVEQLLDFDEELGLDLPRSPVDEPLDRWRPRSSAVEDMSDGGAEERERKRAEHDRQHNG